MRFSLPAIHHYVAAAFLVVALSLGITAVSAQPAHADSADANQTAALQQIIENLQQSDGAQECTLFAEGLSSEDEAYALLDGVPNEVLCHVIISCDDLMANPRSFSIWVYAEQQYDPAAVAMASDQDGLQALSVYEKQSEFDAAMRTGWSALKGSISTMSLKISVDNIVEWYYQSIMDSPSFFNVRTSLSYAYNKNQTTGETVVSLVKPAYVTTSSTEYASMQTSFDTAVDEAMAVLANAGFSFDEGKTLCDAAKVNVIYLLQSWLCNRAAYNYGVVNGTVGSSTTEYMVSHTAYGTLVDGSGVCQSYSLAFATLLEQVGIDAVTLMVNDMNHAWNLVKIGDNWYHIDVTWDDTDKSSNPVRYNWFLKSDTYMLSTSGQHSGWTTEFEVTDSACAGTVGWNESLACTSTTYDSYDWTTYDPSKITGHTWGEWVTTTAAGCETAGEQTRTCTACGAQETQTVDATGHSWGEWQVTTPAGCETAGVETRTCSNCNGAETRSVAATGHSWGEWVTTTAAGCETAGVQTRTCANCSATQTRDVAATGHSWGEWVTTTAAGCETAGVQTRTCTVCDAQETQTIAATGHSWGEWVTATPAGCETTGVQTRTCAVCDAQETQTIAATGHSWGEWETVQEAGYSQMGIQERTCANDASHTQRQLSPATGPTLPESAHSYDSSTTSTWEYTMEDAGGLKITFDTQTALKNGVDFLYVYDGTGTLVGSYTGTELAGKTLEIPGYKVQIKLECSSVYASDDDNFGFAVTSVSSAWLRGDINDSGSVNIVDAQIAYDLIAKNAFQDAQDYSQMRTRCDVNCDAALTASDAFAIQWFVHNGW